MSEDEVSRVDPNQYDFYRTGTLGHRDTHRGKITGGDSGRRQPSPGPGDRPPADPSFPVLRELILQKTGFGTSSLQNCEAERQ